MSTWEDNAGRQVNEGVVKTKEETETVSDRWTGR